jgi:hypothetical protein
MPGLPWTDAELDALGLAATYADYRALGYERTYDAWRLKRASVARERALTEKPGDPAVTWDKKLGSFDWRQANKAIGTMQAIRNEAKRSQHEATIGVAATEEVPVICLSDTHIGAWSADHDLLEQITDEILADESLRIFLLGDLANAAIKLRGVAEVKDDILPPDLQLEYLRSWLDEIAPRVLAACWGNHDAMREEDGVGYSGLAQLQAERTVYTSGIGHIDLTVGETPYRVAISHRYRWRSQDNPCHGPATYIRREAPDVDVAIAGDSHVPGVLEFAHSGRKRVAINSGSTQAWSGYARRWFSLRTLAVFPVVVFDPERYAPRAYWSLEEYRRRKE